MYKTIIGIIATILILGCEEEVSVLTLASEEAVVEAFIYAGESIDSIRVTTSIPYSSDGNITTLDNLEILIANKEESFILTSEGDGYYSNLDHIVQEGQTYTLTFDYNGEAVSATTYVNPKKEITLSQNIVELEKIEATGGLPIGGFGADQVVVDITWDNAESDYYFTIVKVADTNPEYVNGFFKQLVEQELLPERFFRSEPLISDTYSINSRRELQYFATYDINVYRLNPEYAALYESLGSSTISLAEPPSNIVNGLGIFTAITPHKKSLRVVKK